MMMNGLRDLKHKTLFLLVASRHFDKQATVIRMQGQDTCTDCFEGLRSYVVPTMEKMQLK